MQSEWPWDLHRNATSKIWSYTGPEFQTPLDGVLEPPPEASWSISIRFRRRIRAVYITLRIGSGNWLLQVYIRSRPYRVLTFFFLSSTPIPSRVLLFSILTYCLPPSPPLSLCVCCTAIRTHSHLLCILLGTVLDRLFFGHLPGQVTSPVWLHFLGPFRFPIADSYRESAGFRLMIGRAECNEWMGWARHPPVLWFVSFYFILLGFFFFFYLFFAVGNLQ